MSVLIGAAYDDFGFLLSDSRATDKSGNITSEASQKLYRLDDTSFAGCVGNIQISRQILSALAQIKTETSQSYVDTLLLLQAMLETGELPLEKIHSCRIVLLLHNQLDSPAIFQLDMPYESPRPQPQPRAVRYLPTLSLPPDISNQDQLQEVQSMLRPLEGPRALTEAQQVLCAALQAAQKVADQSHLVNNKFQLALLPSSTSSLCAPAIHALSETYNVTLL